MQGFVIGIDVGTGSARAGVFDAIGTLLGSATCPIKMWHPRPGFAEQSSDDIWQAICESVAKSLSAAAIAPADVVGISFDATCSLVAVDSDDLPLPVNDEGIAERNIIVWMDQRAVVEAAEINRRGHQVLSYVGGRISPEMETPKLLWIKRNLPGTWAKAAAFFDLADYLTFRCTGSKVRSLCTLVCKWTYLGHELRWDRNYFEELGIDDLFENDKIGRDVRPMGEPIGCLCPAAAAELGLTVECIVGVGIIDAHAGGLGVLGPVWQEDEGVPLERLESALALIGGTSNCHMAVSREPKYISGVWGPYYSAMVPGLWLTEGGQSSAGSAVDWAIENHAHAPALHADAERLGKSTYELLNQEIERLLRESKSSSALTRDLHVVPDFLGNRSPHADPQALATVDGLSLDQSITSHALLYYAAIQGVAYGTRDIICAMNESGFKIDTIFVTGGGTKNKLWLQEHADATGCKVVLSRCSEGVLLGSAILAATAAGVHSDIYSAMKAMSQVGSEIEPRPETRSFHDAKFAVFKELQAQQTARRAVMAKF